MRSPPADDQCSETNDPPSTTPQRYAGSSVKFPSACPKNVSITHPALKVQLRKGSPQMFFSPQKMVITTNAHVLQIRHPVNRPVGQIDRPHQNHLFYAKVEAALCCFKYPWLNTVDLFKITRFFFLEKRMSTDITGKLNLNLIFQGKLPKCFQLEEAQEELK